MERENRTARIRHDLILDDSTAKQLGSKFRSRADTYLHPLLVVHHLDLQRRIGKGEVRVHPAMLRVTTSENAYLDISQKILDQAFHNILHIVDNNIARGILQIREERNWQPAPKREQSPFE